MAEEDEKKNGNSNGRNQEGKPFCSVLFSFYEIQIPREAVEDLVNDLVGFFSFSGFFKKGDSVRAVVFLTSVDDGSLLTITFDVVNKLPPDFPSPEDPSDSQLDFDNQGPSSENPDQPFKISDYLGGDDDDSAA